ncbi:VacJ family lipoprotein [Telmatospirillum sp. J64-1]|uniref:MlaA family lipoprotein n=1 Tax=Telmatospirillum sp. J64-1 TaxID=2502183 RepID=UPI00115CA3D8|nr:VacJ family lipoprotein [Telmatospirillum sp. J64-1]
MRSRILILVFCAIGLSACASGAPNGVEPPIYQVEEIGRVYEPIAVSDPLEGMNRRLYKFNARFDEAIFLPVVGAYEEVTPSFLRQRVSDFFLNIAEINTFANSVLQASPQKAFPTAFRFIINSTFGVFGIFDVASEMGLQRHSEDFGQTLGYWGVGNGPYVVLPLLGPSNLRDTVGRVTDFLTLAWVTPAEIGDNPAYQTAQYGLQPIDARSRTPFRYHGTGSPFEYEMVRFFYTEMRQIEIGR